MGPAVFDGADSVTAYYPPGTTDWDPTLGGRPTALWLPQVVTRGASFGVQTNESGFDLSWASDRVIVVDACTNLAEPVWSPVSTNTLAGGLSSFSDPQWADYPVRFYRVRAP
jgi:hypothetical protein